MILLSISAPLCGPQQNRTSKSFPPIDPHAGKHTYTDHKGDGFVKESTQQEHAKSSQKKGTQEKEHSDERYKHFKMDWVTLEKDRAVRRHEKDTIIQIAAILNVVVALLVHNDLYKKREWMIGGLS